MRIMAVSADGGVCVSTSERNLMHTVQHFRILFAMALLAGGTKPGMRSVRKGDWKLIQYDVMDGAVQELQLFNLAENPDEFLEQHQDPAVIALTGVTPKENQRNLASDPAYAEKLAEMKGLLLAEMRRLDDQWRLWNQPDDGLLPPKEVVPVKKGKGKGKGK